MIIKSVRHFRLANERDVLKRFQARSPYLRPLIDEVVEPSDPPAIVLKHADDHLLNASILKRLTSLEIKYVARRILKALRILHGDGFVHTGRLCLQHSSRFNYLLKLLSRRETRQYSYQLWPTRGYRYYYPFLRCAISRLRKHSSCRFHICRK